MPTDTPSPLAAAAEALDAIYSGARSFTSEFEYDEALANAFVALRAALASDAAWRARAEAAVARCEAERQQKLILAEMTEKFISGNGRHNLSALLEKARDDEAAARRRYEETCRAG